MRTFTEPQLAILAEEDVTATWLFDISGSPPIYASTKLYDTVYLPLISQFDGITLVRNASENGYISKCYTSFTMTDVNSIYNSESFDGEQVTITLLINGTEFAAWLFDIEYVTASYKTVRFVCRDILRKWLDGVYPNTPIVSDIADDIDKRVDPDFCIPVFYGDVYLPLRCVYTGGERYYVIKEPVVDQEIEIDEVSSPDNWPSKTTWDGDAYAMEQSEQSLKGIDYLCFQPIIFDSDYDGDADSCGIFPVSGGGTGSILTRYSITDEHEDFRKPLNIIYITLQDFGLSTDDLTVNSSALSWMSSADLWFNGGMYQPKSREALLADLLVQCCGKLVFGEDIEITAKSFTSVATITTADVQSGTFSFSWLMQDRIDSAFYQVRPLDRPQTRPVKYPVQVSVTPESPSDEVLDLWMVQDYAIGEKLAKNYFVVKHNRYASVSWTGSRSLLHLEPDDVVSITDSLYGGTFASIIEETTILHDLSIKFSASMYHMELLNWMNYTNDNSEADEIPDAFWDNFTPPDVTGLRICGQESDTTWYGKDLRLCWNDVLIDSEDTGWDEETTSDKFNMPAHKFQDYIVHIHETSSQAEDFDWTGEIEELPKAEIITPNNYFVYTFENNCNDTEDSDINIPSGDLTVLVWARSTSGMVSNLPCVFRAVNDVPTAPDFTDDCDWGSVLWGVWLSWTRHQDSDFSHYLIKTLVYPCSPELTDEQEEVYWSVLDWSRITANHYQKMTQLVYETFADHWGCFRVKAVDLFGNESDYTQVNIRIFAEEPPEEEV